MSNGKIVKIKLCNFQSHSSTTLDLHPGVNVLVGSSDSGKSAVVRALGLVAFNRPSGESWCRRHGAEGNTTVAVTMDTGVAVRRVRGTKNEYQIKSKTASGVLPLKAVGTDVPPNVAEALNLCELNIQRQGEKHFLLSESACETARMLNEVAGLEEIDRAHSAITTIIRETNRELAENVRRLGDYRQEVMCFQGLDEIMGRVDAVREWERTICIAAGDMLRARLAIKVVKDGEAWIQPLIEQAERIHLRWLRLREAEDELRLLSNTQDTVSNRLKAAKEETYKTEVIQRRLALLREQLTEAKKVQKVCPTCGREM